MRHTHSWAARGTEIDLTWDRADLSALEMLELRGLIVDGVSWASELREVLVTCPNFKMLQLDDTDISWLDDDDYLPMDESQLTHFCSLHNLESLHLSKVAGHLLAALLPAATQVRALSKLLAIPSGDCENVDAAFSSLIRGGIHEKSPISAVVHTMLQSSRPPVIVIVSPERTRIRDYKSDDRPEDFKLDVDLKMKEIWKGIEDIGRLFQGWTPVSLWLEEGAGAPEDQTASFLHHSHSIATVHLEDRQFAIGILRCLAEGGSEGYPCPDLILVRLRFPFNDSSMDSFLDLVKNPSALRPRVVILDNYGIQYGHRSFGQLWA